jgi:hypothetical protein
VADFGRAFGNVALTVLSVVTRDTGGLRQNCFLFLSARTGPTFSPYFYKQYQLLKIS